MKLNRISENTIQKDLLNHNAVFSCRVAELFERTFENYEAYVICDEHNNILTPVIKIPSRTKIYESLAYSWHSFFNQTSESDANIKSILSLLKPDVLTFSFPKKPTKSLINQFQKNKFFLIVSESNYLDLTQGFETIFKTSFSVKTRNQCRKALKSDLTFHITKDEKRVHEYYEIYTNALQNWDKGYVAYPLNFYLHLIKENDNVDFWVSVYNNQLIAGIITIKYQEKIYYWASMINREYSKLCPVNGLLYNAIKSYTEQGYSVFDFGPDPKGHGVTHFKKNFGCKKCNYYNYTYKSTRYKYIIEPLNKLR